MVILYIEKTKADETLWFKNPIKKSTHISLVSCSFHNHLYNLPSEGTISDGYGNVVIRIPKGNYTNFSFKNVVDKAVSLGEKKVSITIVDKKYNITPTVEVELNVSLSKLLNITISLGANTNYNINISQPTQDVCIYCDLIDSTQVILNNNYSQILACVELNKAGEKISYNNPLSTPIKNDDYINSIRIWVADSSNQSINTGIYPMRMVIEII